MSGVADDGSFDPPTVRLDRARVADQIIEDLRDQIARGVLAHGSRLPTEKTLAAHYGVSAPTIREAIRALTSMGLVTASRGSRSYVSATGDTLVAASFITIMQLQRVHVHDVMRLVGVLQRSAIERAVTEATADELDAIGRAARDLREATELTEQVEAFQRWHGSVARAAHDPLLEAICRFLVTVLVELERAVSPPTMRYWRRFSVALNDLRDEVTAALVARDGDRAAAAGARYFGRALERLDEQPKLRDARLSEEHFANVMSSLISRRPNGRDAP